MSRRNIKPDPAPPPVKDRPKCPACRKPMRPWINDIYAQSDEGFKLYGNGPIRREWKGEYHGYGAFCTQRCCVNYANVVYRDHNLILVNEARSR